MMLLRPEYKQSHYEYVGLPTGLGYISESLAKNNIVQEVVDMLLGYDYACLKERIIVFKPDLIGINMMSFRFKDHYALLEKIKKDFPGVHIVAGGPHISSFREKALSESSAIDYGVVMEGEEALIELCRSDMEINSIKGILYRKEGTIIYTGDRPFRLDLDNVDFPRYQYFEINKYPKFISLVTSRGCPHSCIFCPVQLTIGKKLRVRSAGSVLNEVDYWYKKGLRVFNIVDDNFAFNKKRVLEICAGIKEKGFKDLVLSCRNGIRADTVDREVLLAMREAGFNYLAFGVESASEKMLKIIKKGESLKDIEQAVKDACELGFMVTLFFIVGLPYETEQDVKESLRFAVKYPVFDVRFYNPMPFPGTELYQWVKSNGYFNKNTEDFLNASSHWVNRPIFFTPELSNSKRIKLFKRLNQRLKKHTLSTKLRFSQDIKKLFNDLGIPPFFSTILARLYYEPIFQTLVIESGFAHKLKNFLGKKKQK
ncbi:MAG: radical SAM protein [Candidatus Omnitrophica bacterium]|nr:radical SAM protein [Candidatus Omnitrophota bacterium]